MLLDSSEALVEDIPLTENVKCNLSAAEEHEYLNKVVFTRNLHGWVPTLLCSLAIGIIYALEGN